MAIYTAADIWINPVRAFGPAFISNQFGGHWVVWLGPILGAISGALCFQFIFSEKGRGSETQARPLDTINEKTANGPGGGGPMDVESRPEKVASHQQLSLVVNDKEKRGGGPAITALSAGGGGGGGGRRSRVRPLSTAAANGEAVFFNYNASSDQDNLSLDGSKARAVRG